MKHEFKALYISKGYSIQDLAKKAGIGINAIYSLGRGANVNMKTVTQVAKALKIKKTKLVSICYGDN